MLSTIKEDGAADGMAGVVVSAVSTMSAISALKNSSPSRRTVHASPKTTSGRKNFALVSLQPTPPSPYAGSSDSNTPTLPSGQGKVISPRNRNTFMRDKINTQLISQQDSDGAVEKHAKMLFQSQPCLLQLINCGEVRT